MFLHHEHNLLAFLHCNYIYIVCLGQYGAVPTNIWGKLSEMGGVTDADQPSRVPEVILLALLDCRRI